MNRIRKTVERTPITIPAIAPPEMPLPIFSEGGGKSEQV